MLLISLDKDSRILYLNIVIWIANLQHIYAIVRGQFIKSTQEDTNCFFLIPKNMSFLKLTSANQ